MPIAPPEPSKGLLKCSVLAKQGLGAGFLSARLRIQCNLSRLGGSVPNGHRKNTLMEMIIRRFAGSFILVSLVLAHYHSPYWLWFTAFVGFNLLQSSFTRFCPLEIILRKLGVGGSCCGVEKPAKAG